MVQSELNKYIAELEELSHRQENDVKPLSFWKVRGTIYPCLKPIAEDTLAAPASQAFVERIVSVCGLLSSGVRNRMSKSLEMRVCLKLNTNALKASGFMTNSSDSRLSATVLLGPAFLQVCLW